MGSQISKMPYDEAVEACYIAHQNMAETEQKAQSNASKRLTVPGEDQRRQRAQIKLATSVDVANAALSGWASSHPELATEDNAHFQRAAEVVGTATATVIQLILTVHVGRQQILGRSAKVHEAMLKEAIQLFDKAQGFN